MCGITGIFNINGKPVSPVILRRMTDAIRHRGPDGEGFFADSFIGLGHRRLAIIDLSPAGHQPMLSSDGLIALVYNGEIYNFQELRAELETMGYQFRSRTDTEVVLYAYAAWGEDCVKRFNGMFAFALWDKRTQTLFMARDRYGIKPLYYTRLGDTLLFGSEQKAITAHPDFRADVDREALLEYFTFQNIFTDKTLLSGVSILPAGCTARQTLCGGELKIQRYWDFCFQEPEHPLSQGEYEEQLDFLFNQAVSRQLVSDVDVGAYLSGGIDSGSITALAAPQLQGLKSFTCGFDLHSASGLELAVDEREAAELMSYKFKTEHYEMVLKAGDMERSMKKVAYHIEEPRVGQSYPNYYAAQLASKFVKVVLAGSGGDELFGGYPWRYYRAVVNDDFEQYIDKYYVFWQRLISNRDLKRVFSPIAGDVSHVWTRDIFRNVFQRHADQLTRPEDYVNHSLYFEAKTFLHGLLVVDDKLSMAHSLETRVPFLDNDLVDFAMRLPVQHKLGNLQDVIRINENEPGKNRKYFEKTRDGKCMLRNIMARYVPEEVAHGMKKGFSAPDASWFRGESMDFVRRVIFNPRARIYNFLDRTAIQDMVTDHLEGRVNRRLLIWSLLSVEEWMHAYL